MDKAKYQAVFCLSFLLLAAVFIASLAIGRYPVPFGDTVLIVLSNFFVIEQSWDSLQEAAVMTLRMPRTVAAVIIGASLSLSGAVYQSIFKNPMVSPDLLGVQAGACVGAAIAMLLGAGGAVIQLFAFTFGLAAVTVAVAIPRLIRNESLTVLVLSGIVISSLMMSVLNLIKFVADTDTKLAEITYWIMGSFAMITLGEILAVLPAVILPAAVILAMRFRLNVLSLGDNEAKTLGVNLRAVRAVFILCSTLMTASCVWLAGSVGWVGLVVPHIARMVIGSDNKKMLPIALLFGATFMLVIDILCRTLTSAELRLGILTGIIGAPFFIFVLFKQRRQIS